MKFNKRVMKYAKNNHYYKPSKIKKYLKLFDKKIATLENSIPKVKCKECKSENIDFEYDDGEYSFEYYLYCNDCGEAFEDDYGYVDAVEEIYYMNYFDSIEMYIWGSGDNIDFESYEWQQYCDKEMDKMIKKLNS